MLAEEFMRAVTNADFVKLVGSTNLFGFSEYTKQIEDAGQDRIVLRVLFQIDHPDGVPLPYYVWLVYPLDNAEAGEVEVYPPDFDNLETYLETPREVRDLFWFEITDA